MGVTAGVVSAVSAGYSINESERGKKKAGKLMKKEEKKEKKDKSLLAMKGQAERRQMQEGYQESGSGAKSTVMTGRRNTLG